MKIVDVSSDANPLGQGHTNGLGLWVTLAIFACLTLPVILFGTHETIYSLDQDRYHVPAIQQISAKWPRLDLKQDCLSAIAPGYHYFLATLGRIFGAKIMVLRMINLLVSLIGLLMLYRFAARNGLPWHAFWLVLPLATSNFFVKSASWVVTDNASLTLVILTLWLLFMGRSAGDGGWLTGIAATAATMCRQLNVWLLGPMLLKRLISKRRKPEACDEGIHRSTEAWLADLAGIVPLLLPALLLCVLYRAWNGFVPPQWRDASLSVSSCPIAYLLSVFGVLGFFYTIGRGRDFWRGCRADPLIWSLAGVGVFAAILSPSSYSPGQGRWGGYFWGAVCLLPNVADRSLLFLFAAPLGGVIVGAVFRAIGRASGRVSALLWLVAVASWAATFVINRQVFHRYYEPMVLVFLVMGSALSMTTGDSENSRSWKGLSVLASLQIALTLSGIAEAFGLPSIAGLRR
jgi:hypothetical protein